MEMTESYRQAKSDFFEFVTSNEMLETPFKQQMRQVNVFMDSPDSRSNPLLSEEPKERNNNSLLTNVNTTSIVANTTHTLTSTGGPTLQSFDSIWNVDRDRDRIDNTMLEDLNKYYWSPEGEHSACATDKLLGNNTDGQIYTLTILNQDTNEQTSSRYWCKEDDVSLPSPTPMEQIQQSSLDLESILNIMPNQLNGFNSEFGTGVLANETIPKVESFCYDDSQGDMTSDVDMTTPVKVESFTYDDSEYTTETDDTHHSPNVPQTQQVIDNQIEFDNNNDWKLSDRNTESNESLLRNALQGKAFNIRYTGQKNIIGKIDSTGELKSVIINNNSKLGTTTLYRDSDDCSTTDATERLVMTLAPTNGVNIPSQIIVFEDPNGNSENPTSTQNVDDILSQFDAPYQGDLEKIKKIANEVAESVQQYTMEPINASRAIYNIQHLDGTVTMIQAPDMTSQQLQLITASPTVTSTKSVTKKYKRTNNKNTNIQQSSTAIQPATSTSNGIRKERSLHYCSICSKGFKDKYSVNVHVRTHTGEKPFACSLCGKSFRQKAHLAKHYQTHVAQKAAAANGNSKPSKQR